MGCIPTGDVDVRDGDSDCGGDGDCNGDGGGGCADNNGNQNDAVGDDA